MTAERGELVVVGAALGAGRWIAEQLLDAGGWSRAVLVDTAAGALRESLPPHPSLVVAVSRDGRFSLPESDEPVRIGSASAVVVAVPPAAMDAVLAGLAPELPHEAEVVVVSGLLTEALEAARRHRMPDRTWAAHLLFDPALTSGDGQSVFAAPARAGDPPPAWFTEAVERSGGVLRTGPAEEHDRAMAVVQATTHRMLVAFADVVTGSGVDLETLWALRTPLFDSVFGLTARALDPRQQAQIAPLQAAGEAASDGLRDSVDRVQDPRGFERAAQQSRDRISGTLFEELRTSAAAAIQAAQARRSEIARHRRDGTLVGLRRIGVPDSVRVGRVLEVTPTQVTLEVLVAGPTGRSALLAGPGLVNAARLGVSPAVTRHDFGVGHVEVVGELELQGVLDARLAFLPRDVRFLVPESVAGSGVARVVAQFEGLRDVRLVDEVVRTGQRSVVVHLAVRADRDVDATVEAVRREVEAAYAWPVGVTRALVRAESAVVYLGPAGTFSEAAARQCAQSIGLSPARLIALPSFDDVLTAVRPGTLGVLPISSSASGLVGRAVDALLASAEGLVASGVVDVAVRFDAYTRGPAPLEHYRGAPVYSHPQGLAQCTRFVRRWGLRPVPTASTAEALALVERSEEPAVALGGADLAGGLRVAEREVDDLSGSITRFLVIGAEGEFAPQRDGSDPTLRTAWIGRDAAEVAALLPVGESAFTELLTDQEGRFLLVSSRSAGARFEGVRLLGTLPWSPRTPLVRPAAD